MVKAGIEKKREMYARKCRARTRIPDAATANGIRKPSYTYTHNALPHRGSGTKQQPSSGRTLMTGYQRSFRTNPKYSGIGTRDQRITAISS